ncbi:MAG: formylglycine-generating enzyme family protein [Bacteroidales bacterium]|nr:formylglycine-generating enzyme family protein [Bacteroidales bacterium]
MTYKGLIIIMLTAVIVAGLASFTMRGEPDGGLSVAVPGTDFKIDLVLVRAGSFTMGATAEQGDKTNYAHPVHQVTLTQDYYIATTEVTQGLYQAVMGENPSRNALGPDYPVDGVNYDDALRFCQRLSELTGRRFGLPTEAQWEYAARGGHKAPKQQTPYVGSANIGSVCWYDHNASAKPHPVAQKQPNALGLYDMSGNVWEWCLDWYDDYTSAPQTDPTGPARGAMRVSRGGSWCNGSRFARLANRDSVIPNTKDPCLGFRLVMLPEE